MRKRSKRALCVLSLLCACYGFWGCLFPDLTLVKGTYRMVGDEAYTGSAEELYEDILDGRIGVVYRSRLLQILTSRRGTEND